MEPVVRARLPAMVKRKALSTVVAESLAEKIRSGCLGPGARLPTEAELCREYDVSRTVVREAVARLRSDGVVIPQQGRGMFVSEAPIPRTFSIPSEMLKTLPETIALLELRLSVEVEAAGLCAERRNDVQAASIRTEMERTDARQEDPSSIAVHYDYDFHLAIAAGTGNALMAGFLRYLRPLLVPRFQLGHIVSAALKDAYYATIHAEHDAIAGAIERRDATAAREAMRTHLINSLDRFRALAAAANFDRSDALPAAAVEDLLGTLVRPLPPARRGRAPAAAADRPSGKARKVKAAL